METFLPWVKNIGGPTLELRLAILLSQAKVMERCVYTSIYISLSLIYIYLCASTSISHSLSTSLYLTVDTERCIYVHCGSATHMANRHCAYGSAARCPRLAHYTLQAFVRPSPTASPIRDRPSGRGARLPFPLLLSFPLSRSLSLSFSLALSLSLIYIYTEREIYIFFSLYRRRPISTQSYPSFRSWLRCAMPRPTARPQFTHRASTCPAFQPQLPRCNLATADSSASQLAQPRP